MAYFTLNAVGKPSGAAGESLTETVTSPSHFFVINNTGAAVRMKVSNSSLDNSRSAAGHTPSHNVHTDGSFTIQPSSHVTMISNSGGSGGEIDVTASEVQAVHGTSVTTGEHLYITKDA